MPVNSRPPVSIVIPTYNGLHLLKKYLPLVVSQLDSRDELVVIDDAGTDGTLEWLEKWYETKKKRANLAGSGLPDLIPIRNKENLRFAQTVNTAVARAHRDYVLLLNNDVAPRPGLLVELFEYLKQQPQPEKVFAIGCLEYEQSEIVSGKSILGGKNRLWFERGMFIHSRAEKMTSGETSWASGGSALFDRKKWLELGGFDKRFYPAYWEDIDLSMRARKQGWQVLFCAQAEVDHHHETTNTTVFGKRKIDLMSWKNAYRFAWRHMSAIQWLQHLTWLPYHLVVTGMRTKGITLRGFLLAILGK